MYLLDTAACKTIIRANVLEDPLEKAIAVEAREKLKKLAEKRLIAVSFITEAELLFSVLKKIKEAKSEQAIMELFKLKWGVKLFLSGINVLRNTAKDSEHYAAKMAEIWSNNEKIAPCSCFIAVQALTRNAYLVTDNTDEFSKVSGLKTLTLEEFSRITSRS
ncbi:type II toxin-antitoxin system VapC family toxin [Thermovibrio ammonificans]